MLEKEILVSFGTFIKVMFGFYNEHFSWFFSNFKFIKNWDYKHVKVFLDLRNVILDWVWLTNCQYYFPKEAQATRDSNEWLNGMNTQHTYTHKRKHTHTLTLNTNIHTHTLTHTHQWTKKWSGNENSRIFLTQIKISCFVKAG